MKPTLIILSAIAGALAFLPDNLTRMNKPCILGRTTVASCQKGFVCIPDPYQKCRGNCKPIGICAEDKLCGGFAAFKCKTVGQVCKDDPRDFCDPTKGGSDCGGLCVWPPRVFLT